MSRYVLSREVDNHGDDHEMKAWSVLVTAIVADRWGEVKCTCGKASRSYADRVFESNYSALIRAAVGTAQCALATSECDAQSLR